MADGYSPVGEAVLGGRDAKFEGARLWEWLTPLLAKEVLAVTLLVGRG